MNALRRWFGAGELDWSVCRLTATKVAVSCAACAAYERLTALVRRGQSTQTAFGSIKKNTGQAGI